MVAQGRTKLPKHREGDTSPTGTAFPVSATSCVICGDSPEEHRWQSGARELGPRRWTELLTLPDSPVCASRCSGHRTSRSTVRERTQHQHGSGDQGKSQEENPLWCCHTRSAWPQTVMVWPGHGDNTVPSSSPRSRGLSGTWLQPTGWTQSSRTPAGMGTAHTGADLPPQAVAESPAPTPWLFWGENQTVAATGTKSQDPATQPKGKGKAKHPCKCFDGSEEIPHHPSPFRWS